LADLGLNGLGVDVIDVVGHGGVAGDYTVHISGADAVAVAGAEMQFAAGDTIKLDLNQSASAAADQFTFDGNATNPFGGLSLTQLVAMGVDQIQVSGVNETTLQGNLTLNVDATLTGVSGHLVSVDVALDAGSYDAHGNGSHMASSLGSADHLGGMTLSQLHGLGVDVIDVVGHGGTPGDYTAHISVTEASIAFNAGLVFDSQDDIVLNVTSEDALSGSTATVLAGVMNLNMQTGFGLDAVQFVDATAIALSGDQGLVNLLMGLTASDTGDYSSTAGLEVKAGADITVSDAMVKALLDAGIFTADAASTIKVDASADTDGHLVTTLAQLAHIGADQVEVAGDAAYVDLGNVTNTDELTSLFESLNASEGYSLVTDADGNAVSTSLLLSSAQAEALAAFIESNTTELSNIGIDHVYAQVVGDAQSGDLLLGTDGHYREVHTAV
jgi:hypothetical protein